MDLVSNLWKNGTDKMKKSIAEVSDSWFANQTNNDVDNNDNDDGVNTNIVTANSTATTTTATDAVDAALDVKDEKETKKEGDGNDDDDQTSNNISTSKDFSPIKPLLPPSTSSSSSSVSSVSVSASKATAFIGEQKQKLTFAVDQLKSKVQQQLTTTTKSIQSSVSVGDVVGQSFQNVWHKAVNVLNTSLSTASDDGDDNSLLSVMNDNDDKLKSSSHKKSSNSLWKQLSGIDDDDTTCDDDNNTKKTSIDTIRCAILELSGDKRNFIRDPPRSIRFEFPGLSDAQILERAKALLAEDKRLAKMRYRLVPAVVNEETFWRNYFYRISLIVGGVGGNSDGDDDNDVDNGDQLVTDDKSPKTTTNKDSMKWLQDALEEDLDDGDELNEQDIKELDQLALDSFVLDEDEEEELMMNCADLNRK